jgi:hypothetical protein
MSDPLQVVDVVVKAATAGMLVGVALVLLSLFVRN